MAEEEKREVEEAKETAESAPSQPDWLDNIDPNSTLATAERFRKRRLANAERIKALKEAEEAEKEVAERAAKALAESKKQEALRAKAAAYDAMLSKMHKVDSFVKNVEFARDQCMQQLGYTWGYVQCIKDLLNSDEEADQNSILGLVYQRADAKARAEVLDEILPALKDLTKENK